MPPENPPDADAQKPAPETVSPPAPAAAQPAPATSAEPAVMPVQTSQPPQPLQTAAEPQFHTLKPGRDIWKMIWLGVFAVNIVPAALYVFLIAFKLLGIGEGSFGAFALSSSFSVVPLLVFVDLVYFGTFFMMKRPKFSELKSVGIKLGIALAATFILSIVYIVLASSDIQI